MLLGAYRFRIITSFYWVYSSALPAILCLVFFMVVQAFFLLSFSLHIFYVFGVFSLLVFTPLKQGSGEQHDSLAESVLLSLGVIMSFTYNNCYVKSHTHCKLAL